MERVESCKDEVGALGLASAASQSSSRLDRWLKQPSQPPDRKPRYVCLISTSLLVVAKN